MWKKGRQGTGYEKLTLFSSEWLKMDAHILHYPDGSLIPPHTDPAPAGKSHHRINVVIWPPKNGGKFCCETFIKVGPLIYFRPDLYEHSVTECQGQRWVLSFGWLTNQKERKNDTILD